MTINQTTILRVKEFQQKQKLTGHIPQGSAILLLRRKHLQYQTQKQN